MTYIATKPFTVALDGIGMNIARIPAGELDIELLGITDSALAWMIGNDLVDEIGSEDVEEVDSDEVGTPDEEAVTETAFAFDNKSDLDEWAKDVHGIDLKRSMKLANMKKDFAAKFAEVVD